MGLDVLQNRENHYPLFLEEFEKPSTGESHKELMLGFVQHLWDIETRSETPPHHRRKALNTLKLLYTNLKHEMKMPRLLDAQQQGEQGITPKRDATTNTKVTRNASYFYSKTKTPAEVTPDKRKVQEKKHKRDPDQESKDRRMKAMKNFQQVYRLKDCRVESFWKEQANYDADNVNTTHPPPPPFHPKNTDEYQTPKRDQLVSILWFKKPIIFATGILREIIDKEWGTVVFYDEDPSTGPIICSEGKNSNEDITYQPKANHWKIDHKICKASFCNGEFRLRTDLEEEQICYDWVLNYPCKILKINKWTGAVLVQQVDTQQEAPRLWITPDYLVGYENYTSSTDHPKKGHMFDLDDIDFDEDLGDTSMEEEEEDNDDKDPMRL